MVRPSPWLVVGVALALVAGCGTPLVVEPGDPGNSCTTNRSCRAGLVCTSGTCASPADDAGTTTSAASCAPGGPGMTDCGDGGESCCTSLPVPGGTFFRDYTNTGAGPTGESAPATVSSFRLDRYEVTVGRFRQFVAVAPPAWGENGWLPTPGSGKHVHVNHGWGLATPGTGDSPNEPGWQPDDDMDVDPCEYLVCDPDYATWTPEPGSNEKLPINCVSWAEAYAFCIWDGGFLPSEAEWEYAAAAGSQQREYPWGTTPPGAASQYAIYDCRYPSGSGSCSGLSNIAPVGTASQGAGAWGQLDLAGNLNEWTLDMAKESFVEDPRCTPNVPCTIPCADCADLRTPDQWPPKLDMGGDFDEQTAWLALPTRHQAENPRTPRNGFRCARTPSD
jgi:sulfatase modifying factor 1